MNIKEFVPKIERYCELRVLDKIKETGNRWLFFFKLKAFELKLEKEVPEELRVLIDDEGNVDLNLLEKSGQAAFEKVPEAEFGPLKFRKEDLADFIRIVHGQE